MVLDLTKVIRNDNWTDRDNRCDMCGTALTGNSDLAIPELCQECNDDIEVESESFDENDDLVDLFDKGENT